MRIQRMSGRAARFVQLLHDLGHLDEADAPWSPVDAGEGPTRVGVDDVRRLAAVHLAERRQGDIDGALGEDWPWLFS